MLYTNPTFSKIPHTLAKVYMDQATVALLVPEGKKWEEKAKLWGPSTRKVDGDKVAIT